MAKIRRNNNKENVQKLYETACSQLGYFTARQAEKAGFRTSNHFYHVKNGSWIREERGIYHLKQFPFSEHSQYMLWYLWSRDRNEIPQGVFSHETALSLYELSDANPAKIHMTVPKEFRRKAGVPEILILHHGTLPNEDTRDFNGFRVTKPIRTIADLLETKELSEDLIRQAAREGVQQGLITIPEIKSSSLFMRKFLETFLRGVA